MAEDPGSLRTAFVRCHNNAMLYYALVYFVVALIAAAFGFGGFGASAEDIARILFVLFLVMALVSLFFHLARRQ